ncbi:MAG: DHH family phosphoesterase [Patescibacteria group bacterium]|nr:DHH family phosphoesterase [Patescibacteria group bacterium]
MLETKEQIFAAIEKSSNILIIFRKNYNGDTIGSALSLSYFLQSIGKPVDVICDDFKIKDKFNFLPYIEDIKSGFQQDKKFVISLDTSKIEVDSLRYERKENSLDIIIEPKSGYFSKNDITAKEPELKYDLIFTINSPDLESLGKIFENHANFFYNTTIINIDHLPNNERFGQINLVELTASSTAEIIFFLLKKDKNDSKINEKIADLLLAGIIDSTNSFKSMSVTAKTLTVVAELIALGANREKIIENLHQVYSVDNLKLWGRILARLKEDVSGKLVWSLVTNEDFVKTNTNESYLRGVIDDLIINMPTVKLAVLFFQDADNKIKVILKDKDKIDLLSILSAYCPREDNGMVVLTTSRKHLLEAEKEMVEKLKSVLEK